MGRERLSLEETRLLTWCRAAISGQPLLLFGDNSPGIKKYIALFVSGNGIWNMKIDTRDFGQIEIDPEQVIEFYSPIYGFEEMRHFVILSDDSIPGPFCWLQSTEQAEVCFILVDPTAIMPEYAPEMPQETRKLLHITQDQDIVLRAMTVIPKNFAESTMNLKSPIVLNPQMKCAAQVILDAEYPLRARLMEDSLC